VGNPNIFIFGYALTSLVNGKTIHVCPSCYSTHGDGHVVELILRSFHNQAFNDGLTCAWCCEIIFFCGQPTEKEDRLQVFREYVRTLDMSGLE